MASGIYITGNLFNKLELFCKFMGRNFISKATFHRIQTHYIIPEVLHFWDKMKSRIWQLLAKETLILCGDGRNDSPGFNAKYCAYILAEQFLDVIVDLEIVDKRETDGVSTNIEVGGLRRLLERIVGKLIVSEIVTDASSAVIALVRRLKGLYCKTSFNVPGVGCSKASQLDHGLLLAKCFQKLGYMLLNIISEILSLNYLPQQIKNTIIIIYY